VAVSTDPSPLGKWLMLIGLVLFLAGAITTLLARWGIVLGRLPGDIHIAGKQGSFHFPWVTSLILSVVASLLLNWWSRK